MIKCHSIKFFHSIFRLLAIVLVIIGSIPGCADGPTYITRIYVNKNELRVRLKIGTMGPSQPTGIFIVDTANNKFSDSITETILINDNRLSFLRYPNLKTSEWYPILTCEINKSYNWNTVLINKQITLGALPTHKIISSRATLTIPYSSLDVQTLKSIKDGHAGLVIVCGDNNWASNNQGDTYYATAIKIQNQTIRPAEQ